MDTRFLGHRPLLSGRRVTVGPLLPITAPLANDYDPALFEGAVAYGSDRQFYYSDGVDWIVPSEDVVIARPSALVPTTAFEQMQLRLTQFYSPAGLSQIGARFEVAAAEDGFGAPLFTRTLTGEVSSYTTLYPEDGLVPGQAFWWRALYQGTEGQQSDWSTPFAQVYPAFITNPAPVTRDGITSGTVEITPFESAFGFLYTETQVELFAPEDPDTVVASVTEVGGPAVVIPSSLAEGQEYLWRARYGGRPNQAGALTYSDWTAKRSVFNGAASIVLVYDPALALNRTIRLPLGLESTIAVVNVIVDWGDGTSETVTSRGTRTHQYAPEVAGPVTVTISGTLTHYGGDVDQTGLVRIDSFGFKLGLVSLRRALARVSPALGVVNARIPPQVSDVSQMFLRAALDPALDISQMQFPGVTTMAGMFERAAFNGDLSGWDVSGVTNMAGMFRYGTFNNDTIAGWDIASVTDLSHAFAGSGNGVLVQMNPDISAWNTASVTSMFMMFADNTAFNRPIGGWETSACTDFRRMFYNAEAFNQPLTDWDMSGATSLNQMFNRADAFNGDLSGWNVSNVTDMSEMFSYSSSYSGDLSAWDVSSVTDMTAMFRSVEVDLDLRGWDVRQVRSMASMFNSNTAGRLQVSTWQPVACTDFSDMFFRCFAFDDDISGWDVSTGRDLSRMLFRTYLFNAPIQSWDVSSAETLSGLLQEARSFDRPLGAWTLNPDGVDLDTFAARTDDWSPENYARTLTGWANTIAANGGPVDVFLDVGRTNGSNLAYDAVAYAPGAVFEDAVSARAFLTATLAVEITNADDPAADGLYTYQPAQLSYTAPSGWTLLRVGLDWVLLDATGAQQATALEAAANPARVASWDGALTTATLRLAGAGWTITGDAPA